MCIILKPTARSTLDFCLRYACVNYNQFQLKNKGKHSECKYMLFNVGYCTCITYEKNTF